MSKKKEIGKERDELGFTLSDYFDMQQLKDQDGKTNETLTNGWDVTPEQITLINNPHHPMHRIAVIAFYDVNFKLLNRLACGYVYSDKTPPRFKTIVNQEDLLQQLFCDLLSGDLKLPHNPQMLRKKIIWSFKYALVGGMEGVENVENVRTAQPAV